MIRMAVIVLLTLGAVGTCAAWAFQRGDLTLVPPQKTEAGRLESHLVLFIHENGLTIEYGPYIWRTRPTYYFASFAGWGYAHHKTANQEYRGLMIPYWALLPLFATYPAVVFIRGPLRRWRRRRRGLCLNCGYNLRGLPEPRCPECGTEF